jgi:hypothetical protein
MSRFHVRRQILDTLRLHLGKSVQGVIADSGVTLCPGEDSLNEFDCHWAVECVLAADIRIEGIVEDSRL